jgi:hypothetical protein
MKIKNLKADKWFLLLFFIILSGIDLLANSGSVLIPFIGGMAETVQESINEVIQIIIVSYFALKK